MITGLPVAVGNHQDQACWVMTECLSYRVPGFKGTKLVQNWAAHKTGGGTIRPYIGVRHAIVGVSGGRAEVLGAG